MLAFDSDLAPIVGQQITLTNGNRTTTAVGDRISLLITRANAGDPSLPRALRGSRSLVPDSADYIWLREEDTSARRARAEKFSPDFVRLDEVSGDCRDADLVSVAIEVELELRLGRGSRNDGPKKRSEVGHWRDHVRRRRNLRW